VLGLMGTPPLLAEDLQYLALCVAAANRAVQVWRPDLEVPQPGDTPDPMVALGAGMMAVNWFQRRSSDVAAFAEFGGPPPAISRDIEHLLRINRAANPVIA
jgi:hypothetical protein